MPVAEPAPRSIAQLTEAVFGEALSLSAVFDRLGVGVHAHEDPRDEPAAVLWVGSVGYERFKESGHLATRLATAGVERLVDVRELPISRRRGYAKTALSGALADAGIEYVHVRALGNPKPFRDLYKSGRVDEGRDHYRRHLLTRSRDALDELVPLLRDKRTALMCVEHDPATCHRQVILDALRDELGLELEVAALAEPDAPVTRRA